MNASTRRPSGDHTRRPRLGANQTRLIDLGRKSLALDEEARTLELSFSSELPVQRWFGWEVLSHASGAADLTRLNDGAPLLFNHDYGDVLGVVESAEIGADRKGRAVVRFARTRRGDEAMGMVQDGVLRNVSFTYQANKYEEPDPDEGDGNTYVSTKWVAFEISIVAVPADHTVGVGRSHQQPKGRIMDREDINDADNASTRGSLSRRKGSDQARNVESERERISGLMALCKMYNIEQRLSEFVDQGLTVTEARSEALDHVLRKNGGARPVAALGAGDGTPELGLTDRESQKFSLVRAVNACLSRDWSDAGFERDCSRAVAKKLGREPRGPGFFVPLEVQQRTPWIEHQTRAPYQVGTAIQGGNLVATQLLYDFFVDALRNTSQVAAAGATILSGLSGNVDIPRRISTTGTYWIAESAAVTESEGTFDKLSLRPKTIGALSKMSRNMLIQATPAIELLARQDILKQISLGIDLAALSGSGVSDQPRGIVNTSGIGAVIGGTNGLAVTMDHIVQLEAALANSNAPIEDRKYLLNTKTIATLKSQKATTGSYIWTTAGTGQRSGTPPSINGYPVLSTNQLRSTLTKGASGAVCSELVVGAWSELFIGQWGVLEILVNPYDSTGFTTGDVLIRGLQTCDIAVAHAASFAAMSDALTP